MVISCIGRKFPSDLTLKKLTKDELIDLLNIYFEKMNFDSFQEMVSKAWCEEEQ